MFIHFLTTTSVDECREYLELTNFRGTYTPSMRIQHESEVPGSEDSDNSSSDEDVDEALILTHTSDQAPPSVEWAGSVNCPLSGGFDRIESGQLSQSIQDDVNADRDSIGKTQNPGDGLMMLSQAASLPSASYQESVNPDPSLISEDWYTYLQEPNFNLFANSGLPGS